MNGGESGIRTHGTFDSTQAFQACALNLAADSTFILLENYFLESLNLKLAASQRSRDPKKLFHDKKLVIKLIF